MNQWDVVTDKNMYYLHVKLAMSKLRQNVVTSEQVRTIMHVYPLIPNWFGGAYRAAATQFGYKNTGKYQKSTIESRKKGVVAIWEKCSSTQKGSNSTGKSTEMEVCRLKTGQSIYQMNLVL